MDPSAQGHPSRHWALPPAPGNLPPLGPPHHTPHPAFHDYAQQPVVYEHPRPNVDEDIAEVDVLETAGVDSSTVGQVAGIRNQELHPNGQPRRPMNAFMIFARHRRPTIQAKEPGLKTGEISKRLSHDWKILPDGDKAYYLEQARLLKDEFHSRFPDYVYKRRPNNSVAGKKKTSSLSQQVKGKNPALPLADDGCSISPDPATGGFGPVSHFVPVQPHAERETAPSYAQPDTYQLAPISRPLPARSPSYPNEASLDAPLQYEHGRGQYERTPMLPGGLARPASLESFHSPGHPSSDSPSRPLASYPQSGMPRYDYGGPTSTVSYAQRHQLSTAPYEQPAPYSDLTYPASTSGPSPDSVGGLEQGSRSINPYVPSGVHGSSGRDRYERPTALYSIPLDSHAATYAPHPADPMVPKSAPYVGSDRYYRQESPPAPPRSARLASAPHIGGTYQAYTEAPSQWSRSSWSGGAEGHPQSAPAMSQQFEPRPLQGSMPNQSAGGGIHPIPTRSFPEPLRTGATHMQAMAQQADPRRHDAYASYPGMQLPGLTSEAHSTRAAVDSARSEPRLGLHQPQPSRPATFPTLSGMQSGMGDEGSYRPR